MNKKSFKYLQNKNGTNIIEAVLYVTIFLILLPILLSLSINSIQQKRGHDIEKYVSDDIKFVGHRIYDAVSGAKKVDAANSAFDEAQGRLFLVMPDDSVVVIEMDPIEKKAEITEDGITSDLSSGESRMENLYFERISDELNDPEIIFGVATHLRMAGPEDGAEIQENVISASLEYGDFDGDGCLDNMDKFPKHVQCCGDADVDGICDAMDNCILNYNPFQEDFDEDEIGDVCDGSIFFDGDGDGNGDDDGLGAFGCNPEDELIALINHEPPLPPGELKNILMSASPLSPAVLQAVVDRDPAFPAGFLQQIFIFNTKLPDEVYLNILNMDLPAGTRNLIIAAQEDAEEYAWQGEQNFSLIEYEVEILGEGNIIRYSDAKNLEGEDSPLGENGEQRTDVFIVTVSGGSGSVYVTTKANGTATNTLNEGDTIIDALGFMVTLENIVDDTYAFTVSSIANTSPLGFVEFDFGEGAVITGITSSDDYVARRYSFYCSGGCSEDCGDIGTGIITGDIFTDMCYRMDDSKPEWCLIWNTFVNDNGVNPAYIGGTQEGEEELYWEKSFKTVLSRGQIDQLQSITVAGEIAYQSVAQFFCDSFSSSCPMNGSFISSQNVELYNWETDEWEIVGDMNLDILMSDQQVFEIKYDGANPQRFIGGEDDRIIKARMEFHWDGVIKEGRDDAPSFMLIDYFTLHLKW